MSSRGIWAGVVCSFACAAGCANRSSERVDAGATDAGIDSIDGEPDGEPLDAAADPDASTVVAPVPHAIATRSQSWFRVYALRAGVFERIEEINALGHTARIAWGDADGDGIDEVASHWFDLAEGLQVRIRGDRGTGLEELQIIDNGMDTLLWFDANGDQYADLWTGRPNFPTLYCGGPGDLAFCWIGGPVPTPQLAAAHDYDGDGDVDLAVTNSTEVRILRNDAGQLALAQQLALADDPVDLDWVDIDDVGGKELVIVENTIPPHPWEIARWNGVSFVLEASTGITNADALMWADFDGDGDEDPLACDSPGSWAGTLYRRSSATYEVVEAFDGCDGAWADYDADGDPDFAYRGLIDSDGALVILRNEAGDLVEAQRILDDGQHLAWGRCALDATSECFPNDP